jgi:hypothetical protein
MLPEARVWVPQTCSKCHSAIYNQYKDSVHGSALIGEGNPDVPTCIDCHNVHNIQDPTTAAFRLNSPQICAKCHTDEAKMAKYGISTQVLNTYVADFHGTTVMLFEKMTPDAETNKPVCYDCHGIHDIRRADDPEKGLQVRENLLKRCQVCHPNATTNFSAAWLSHYIPSPEKNPIVYYVNLFYKFFIPTVLGGMALLVALDLNKLARRRSRGLAATRVQEEIVREKSPLEGEALPAAEPDHLEASAVEPEVPNEEEQPVEIDSGTEQTPEPSEELTVDSEDEAQPGPPPDVNDPGIDQEANRE